MPTKRIPITLITALAPFTGRAANYSYPMGTTRGVEVSTSVTGAGNNITNVSAQIRTPSGSVGNASRNPNSTNFYDANFAQVGLSEYGTYTVTVNSTATGPGGSANAPTVTHTIGTYNPYQDRTYTVQYVPANVPAGWLRAGNTFSGTYRVYQYNVPASFSGGTNNKYSSQTVTAWAQGTAAEVLRYNAGAIQARVTVSTGGQSNQSIGSNGQWSYTFN